MSRAVRRAVPVAAVACLLAAAAPAPAQTPSPTPTSQPPLTGQPPVKLGSASATPTPTATAAPTSGADGADGGSSDELARTGSDAGLLALAGASLLGMGLSLRRLLAAHGGF
jgi:hypothetical protein